MADSREVDIIGSSWSPEFIQELLPSAERTALLHHLSFVCLGGFPNLERMIREQASEIQMLFKSSEAVLMKCVDTSSNLVTSQFPLVIEAAEKNKPVLTVKHLVNARTCISDIIRAVDDIITRYEHQNQRVKTCSSDVHQERYKADEKLKNLTFEMKALEDALFELKLELRKIVSENNGPRDREWDIKIRQTELQMKLANCSTQLGEIPSPVHLKPVQKCLDQIRQILNDLKKFWIKVGVLLETLKDKTFAGEDLIKDLEDVKEEFLHSIEDAKQYCKRFGECCQNAQNIFSVQSKDAYKFLEVNPSALSEDERNKQYNSILAKLKKINPQGSTKE